MAEWKPCHAPQGLLFSPLQLSCLLLLSAFFSLPLTLGQVKTSAAQLLCTLHCCWNGLWCLTVLCVMPKRYYLCTGSEETWESLSRKLLSQEHGPRHSILGETSHPSSPPLQFCFHWAEYEYETEYLPVELHSLRGEKWTLIFNLLIRMFVYVLPLSHLVTADYRILVLTNLCSTEQRWSVYKFFLMKKNIITLSCTLIVLKWNLHFK